MTKSDIYRSIQDTLTLFLHFKSILTGYSPEVGLVSVGGRCVGPKFSDNQRQECDICAVVALDKPDYIFELIREHLCVCMCMWVCECVCVCDSINPIMFLSWDRNTCVCMCVCVCVCVIFDKSNYVFELIREHLCVCTCVCVCVCMWVCVCVCVIR